jgi:hypothetical protein
MQSKDKHFPIKTKTACQLKWAWSTINLSTGNTGSCHRTGSSALTSENFMEFHNTPRKIKERNKMLAGEWPENSCGYCKKIEDAGGSSDRMRMSSIPNLSPVELEDNPRATKIDPTLVEVYLNNACNMGCLYCPVDGLLSSYIAMENKANGYFKKNGVELKEHKNKFKHMLPHFLKWFETGFQKLKRFHVLGGEPFFQKLFIKILDKIEQHPNPDCELNVVTNLMVSEEKLKYFIDRFYSLTKNRSIKRVDITCSIDCWGPEQEHVRWGLKLDQWEKNFETLLANKWLTLNINQCISLLTIKTMPALLKKLQTWREARPVGHFFSGVDPEPDYLKAEILGENFFKEDAEKILELMPVRTEQDKLAYDYMKGILNHINSSKMNKDQIANLIIYLDEKDKRRGTKWEHVFPWLIEFRKFAS